MILFDVDFCFLTSAYTVVVGVLHKTSMWESILMLCKQNDFFLSILSVAEVYVEGVLMYTSVMLLNHQTTDDYIGEGVFRG